MSLLPPPQRDDKFERLLRRELVVDLFDPPQREAYRKRIVELKAQCGSAESPTARPLTEKQIAEQLGITETAVQRSAALERLMRQLCLCDPYLPVTAPPDDFRKLRRHKHPRYCFEPLPGTNGV